MSNSTRCYTHPFSLTAQTVSDHFLTVAFFAVRLTFIGFVAAAIEVFSKQDSHAVRALALSFSIVGIFICTLIVMGHVFAVSHQFKVFNSIVSYFSIYMMNMFISSKSATYVFFHNISMFSYMPTIWCKDFYIINTWFASRKIMMCGAITLGGRNFPTVSNLTIFHMVNI